MIQKIISTKLLSEPTCHGRGTRTVSLMRIILETEQVKLYKESKETVLISFIFFFEESKNVRNVINRPRATV